MLAVDDGEAFCPAFVVVFGLVFYDGCVDQAAVMAPHRIRKPWMSKRKRSSAVTSCILEAPVSGYYQQRDMGWAAVAGVHCSY